MPLIALVGAHGAGKTTLGRLLAARLGVPFEVEIGAELALDARWRPTGGLADANQPTFDDEVIRREIDRDARTRSPLRVVESWHPGNLAYAERRSPSVVAKLAPVVRATAPREAVCLPVMAPPEVLAARASELGDLQFFEAVGHAASLWAARLGWTVTRPVWSHDMAPEALLERALAALEEVRWSASS